MQKPSTNDAPENKQIQRIAFYAFLINFGLAGVKAVLAHLSGSLAVTASAIDSATDSIASLMVLGGFTLSNRKSPTFPYGLYKIENVISVIVAMFIFFAGFEIVRKAFSPDVNPPTISAGLIGWFIACMCITFLFGQYAMRAGRRTESPTLIAEGRHRQVDALSSLVVLSAVTLHYFGWDIDLFGISIDHIAAVLVLIFIGYAGWELLSDGMRVLLDASLDPEMLHQVRKIIEAQPIVTEVRRVAGRNAGRYRFLEAVVALRINDLKKAHATTQRIEADIRKQIPWVERVVIHYEPGAREFTRIAVPLSDTKGHVSSHFGKAPYYSIMDVRTESGTIERQEVVANPHTKVPKAKGIRVAEWLIAQKVDVVVVKEDIQKKGPSYVFADAGVELQLSDADELGGVIDSFGK